MLNAARINEIFLISFVSSIFSFKLSPVKKLPDSTVLAAKTRINRRSEKMKKAMLQKIDPVVIVFSICHSSFEICSISRRSVVIFLEAKETFQKVSYFRIFPPVKNEILKIGHSLLVNHLSLIIRKITILCLMAKTTILKSLWWHP